MLRREVRALNCPEGRPSWSRPRICTLARMIGTRRSTSLQRRLAAELHEDPGRGVLPARLVARDLYEAGAFPGAHGALVPGIGIDGHPLAAALVEEMHGHRAGGVRPETTPSCGRDQEHVEAVGMHLEVADRFGALLDDPGLDVFPSEPLLHLRAGERLLVPVA